MAQNLSNKILVILKKLLGGFITFCIAIVLFSFIVATIENIDYPSNFLSEFISGIDHLIFFNICSFSWTILSVITLAIYNHYMWRLYKNYIKSKIKYKLARFIIILAMLLATIPLCMATLAISFLMPLGFIQCSK